MAAVKIAALAAPCVSLVHGAHMIRTARRAKSHSAPCLRRSGRSPEGRARPPIGHRAARFPTL